MRLTAQCACGWQRSLSPFYAGRRLRCPECGQVVPARSLTVARSRPLAAFARRPVRGALWLQRALLALVLVVAGQTLVSYEIANSMDRLRDLERAGPEPAAGEPEAVRPEPPRFQTRPTPERDTDRLDEF